MEETRRASITVEGTGRWGKILGGLVGLGNDLGCSVVLGINLEGSKNSVVTLGAQGDFGNSGRLGNVKLECERRGELTQVGLSHLWCLLQAIYIGSKHNSEKIPIGN